MALCRSTFRSLRGALTSRNSRYASALVLGQHEDGVLSPSCVSAITAAAQAIKGGNISLLLAGCGASLDAASKDGVSAHPAVSQVLLADSAKLEHQLAEPLADLLVWAQRKGSYSHIVTASDSFGKNILPRAAALLDVSPVSDVTQIIDEQTFIRPIYAGNALSTVRYKGSGPCMFSVRPTSFPSASKLSMTGLGSASVIRLDMSEYDSEGCGRSKWVNLSSQNQSERPELGSARVVISGGRGLKSAEGFRLLEALADRLGGAVGASRAAVDAGFVPNDMQIGQTGKVVAPELYIAVGISGAIQHIAGIKDSKVIVAINKDKEAPIFQVADYGLAADLFEVLPELISKVPKVK